MALPLAVRSDGDRCTEAPKISIIIRR